jgi:hypothetical protein
MGELQVQHVAYSDDSPFGNFNCYRIVTVTVDIAEKVIRMTCRHAGFDSVAPSGDT